MDIMSEIKAEDVSSEREYGVSHALLSANIAGKMVGLNVNLKDELKMKILERRKKEGKSEINLEEVKNQEPKQYALTPEELERNERRRKANRIAARKCRNKKRQVYATINRAMEEQLARKVKLVTAIPELEREIADIRHLWRLISIPGTKVEPDSSEPDKGVAITVEAGRRTSDKDGEDGAVADGNDHDEKEVVFLNHCRIKLIIPKSLRRKTGESDGNPSIASAAELLMSLKTDASEPDSIPATSCMQSLKREDEISNTGRSLDNPMAQRRVRENPGMVSSPVIPVESERKAEGPEQEESILSRTSLKRKPEDADIIRPAYLYRKLPKKGTKESTIAASATSDINVESGSANGSTKTNEETIPSDEILGVNFNSEMRQMTHNLNKRLRALLLLTASSRHRDNAKPENKPDRSEIITPAISSTTHSETLVATSTIIGEDKPIILSIPTVVTNDSDDNDACTEKSRDECERAWSETSGMKLRTLVAGLPDGMELEEVSSVDNFGYSFRSADENAPHSLSSSQSSNGQADEMEGYDEMKPGQPIVLSAQAMADDNTSDSDSDVEVIELEERKLVIDLTD